MSSVPASDIGWLATTPIGRPSIVANAVTTLVAQRSRSSSRLSTSTIDDATCADVVAPRRRAGDQRPGLRARPIGRVVAVPAGRIVVDARRQVGQQVGDGLERVARGWRRPGSARRCGGPARPTRRARRCSTRIAGELLDHHGPVDERVAGGRSSRPGRPRRAAGPGPETAGPSTTITVGTMPEHDTSALARRPHPSSGGDTLEDVRTGRGHARRRAASTRPGPRRRPSRPSPTPSSPGARRGTRTGSRRPARPRPPAGDRPDRRARRTSTVTGAVVP